MSIKPGEVVVVEDNPIEQIVTLVATLGRHRQLFASGFDEGLLNDCAMLCDHEAPLGLTTRWARKVAQPVMKAYRIMATDEEDKGKQAQKALRDCSDLLVREECSVYVAGKTGHVA